MLSLRPHPPAMRSRPSGPVAADVPERGSSAITFIAWRELPGLGSFEVQPVTVVLRGTHTLAQNMVAHHRHFLGMDTQHVFGAIWMAK